MKIEELIKRLEAIQSRFGELDVHTARHSSVHYITPQVTECDVLSIFQVDKHQKPYLVNSGTVGSHKVVILR